MTDQTPDPWKDVARFHAELLEPTTEAVRGHGVVYLASAVDAALAAERAQPPDGDSSGATCEKRGHLYGADGVCVFCESPKPSAPVEPTPPEREPTGWYCGCGWANGLNLNACGRCTRPASDCAGDLIYRTVEPAPPPPAPCVLPLGNTPERLKR